MIFTRYNQKKRMFQVSLYIGMGLLFLIVAASAGAAQVTWSDYRKPLKNVRVFQHGKAAIEGATITVNLPKNFLNKYQKIVLKMNIESRTNGGFEAFRSFIQVNKAVFKTYKIKTTALPYKQTHQVAIAAKDLKSGANVLQFTFRWDNSYTYCTAEGCGYIINEVSFKDAVAPTPTPTPRPKATRTPRPKATRTPRPKSTSTPSPIPALLKQADEYFEKKWYLTPAESNAFDTYKQVLRLESGNRHAREKLRDIMRMYTTWGDNNAKEGNYEKARSYYERGLTVATFLVKELRDVSVAKESQELKKQLELAANPPTPTPAPTLTPIPTPIPTQTPTPIPTPTATQTSSPSPTPAATQTPMPTPIPTATPIPVPTVSSKPSPALDAVPTPFVVAAQANSDVPLEISAELHELMQRPGNIYAVLVGIADYDDEWIPDFRFTERDARALYETLIDPQYGAIPAENIRLLVGQDATQRKIRRTIGTWLPQHARENDVVLIYFAGHGAFERQDGYWIPADGVNDDLYSTALSHRKIREMLTQLHARHLVLMLDAFYGIVTMFPEDIELLMQTESPWHEFQQDTLMLMSASDGKTLSVELDEPQHGAFTYGLLEALQGKADADANGAITADEIALYAQQYVANIAGQQQSEHNPQRVGHADREFPIAFHQANLQKQREVLRIEGYTTRLQELYQAGDLSESQYQRAIDILQSDARDQILEDFLTETISLELFQQIF